MQLVGFSFTAPGGPLFELEELAPLGRGYLPLERLTAVLGRNDTGKSHLLDMVYDTLRGGSDSPKQVLLFVKCQPIEFEGLTNHAISDLVPESEPARTLEIDPTLGDRPSWWRAERFPASELEESELLLPSATDTWRDRLLDTTSEREAWRKVIDAATGERIVALEPADIDGKHVWNLFWCLPPFDAAAEEVQDNLLRLGLSESSDQPDLWAESWTEASADGSCVGAHRRLRAAPLIVSPLGRTNLPIVPGALRLPLSFDQLRDETEEIIGRVLSTTFWASSLLTIRLEATWEEYEGGVRVSAFAPLPEESWFFQEPDGGWWLHPDAAVACQVIETTMPGLLPPSIADQYEILVGLNRPQDWPSRGRIEIRLRQRDRGPGISFALDSLAEGYRLWVQLGLLEAADVLERSVLELRSWTDLLEEALTAELDDVQDELEPGTDLESCQAKCKELLKRLRTEQEIHVPPTSEEVAVIPGGRISRLMVNLLEERRRRFYVIDEPERHLHPRLQREFAGWLPETLRRYASQALIATHSIPFMGISEGASFTYLVRERGGPAVLEPLSPREMEQFDSAAEELGLDRGELLAFVNVFLWVEGAMDKAVVETLFGPELRQHGIYIGLLHGYPNTKGILDSALLRFTKAQIAVWLDNASRAFLDRLKVEPGAATQAAREEKRERKTLAQLVLAARHEGRGVEPVGPELPDDDVFDLLDEDVIREPDLYPKFPGHDQARNLWSREQTAWNEAHSGDGYPGGRKGFYSKTFQTPVTEESCTRIAERMRELGPRGPLLNLKGVVEDCERLALRAR